MAGLLGASGLVAWTVLSRPEPTSITSEQAHSFDLNDTSSRDDVLVPPRPSELLHDAVGSPAASPRPIIPESLAAAAPAPAPAPRPEVPRFLTSKLESAVLGSKAFMALMRAPGAVVVRASALKSPKTLRAFLEDKAAVDAFLNATATRVVLNSPLVAKTVLGSAALVRAFVQSPAMSDGASVRALLESRMALKIMDCPGVQGALEDPGVIRNLSDPAVLQWLSRNPEVMQAMAGAAPALARSLAAVR